MIEEDYCLCGHKITAHAVGQLTDWCCICECAGISPISDVAERIKFIQNMLLEVRMSSSIRECYEAELEEHKETLENARRRRVFFQRWLKDDLRRV